MNVVLLVVDSLRACALTGQAGERPRTPFLDQLARRTVAFERAYATECWTLPTHASLFTGLLPSAHGAHFQTMGYAHSAPTIAEILAKAGFYTEMVTRNFVFDGTVPGITRGFQQRSAPLAEVSGLNPVALFLALAKPRVRRHIRSTGFFHPLHRDNHRFLATFARTLFPADARSLAHVLEVMSRSQRAGRPYFVFCNLYDVHAPYSPRDTSILRSSASFSGLAENFKLPFVLAALGEHRYLRPGFEMGAANRHMLLQRYHRAIELMDAKLADFWGRAEQAGLLDETLVIITSDHGEAFGEHGLYLHDASVYDTHLHVPLWVHHPRRAPAVIDDVVSARDLFGLIRAVALGDGVEDTILDPAYREAHPIALAEHFYYPHRSDMLPRYRQNVIAAITRGAKVILRDGNVECYDLNRDPDEREAMGGNLGWFEDRCRRTGFPPAALTRAIDHLRAWRANRA